MSNSTKPYIDNLSSPKSITSRPSEIGLRGEKLTSAFEVNWDGENDEEDPMNWKSAKKWQNLGLISIMSLST